MTRQHCKRVWFSQVAFSRHPLTAMQKTSKPEVEGESKKASPGGISIPEPHLLGNFVKLAQFISEYGKIPVRDYSSMYTSAVVADEKLSYFIEILQHVQEILSSSLESDSPDETIRSKQPSQNASGISNGFPSLMSKSPRTAFSMFPASFRP
ncbi:hypothetical protein BDV12DRAFT_194906 [Aspergillus spectabilis]